jgi:hypothetical protein
MLDKPTTTSSDVAIPHVVSVAVRVGTPADIHPMMDLALAACEENGLIRPNPIKLLNEIWSSLNLHHGVVGIVGEPGKPIEAAVLLRAESMWYSDDLILNERAVFVAEQFRAARGGRARLLVEFAKTAADKLGIPLIIGIMSDQRTEGKVRLYERQMGKSSGAYWIYNGKTGAWKGEGAAT